MNKKNGNEPPEKKDAAEKSQRPPTYKVRDIEIARIRIRGKRRALQREKLRELIKSIDLLGLQTPITVRIIKRNLGWAKLKTFVLVTGQHRLEAMKRLGATTIPCFLMKGSKREARMWKISENIHRADLRALDHDEQVAEWVQLSELVEGISGQKVQKMRKRGRPKSGISEAARRLPVKGKSEAGKRRTVERALKVANIFPEAKDAARKMGLDDNRSILLKIAAEKTPQAQLAKVGELSATKRNVRHRRASGAHRIASASELKGLVADETAQTLPAPEPRSADLSPSGDAQPTLEPLPSRGPSERSPRADQSNADFAAAILQLTHLVKQGADKFVGVVPAALLNTAFDFLKVVIEASTKSADGAAAKIKNRSIVSVAHRIIGGKQVQVLRHRRHSMAERPE